MVMRGGEWRGQSRKLRPRQREKERDGERNCGEVRKREVLGLSSSNPASSYVEEGRGRMAGESGGGSI